MTKLSIIKENVSNIEDDIIFEKKQPSTLKSLYLSKVQNSPFKRTKESIVKYGYFKKISLNIERFFLKFNKVYMEKEEINKVVENLIEHKSFNDLNDFFKNGLVLTPYLNNLLLNKISRTDLENTLIELQKNQPLYGSLGHIVFTSAHFQIYCHDILEKMITHFPQEYLPPSILDNFNDYDFKYKDFRIKDFSYNKENALAALHMHNICLNPKFSIPLFFHILERALGNRTDFEYSSVKHSIGDSLDVIFPYIQPLLSQEDKIFLKDLLKNNLDKLFKEGASDEIKEIINKLYNKVVENIQPGETLNYKTKMLERVRTLYNNENDSFHHFLPLHIEDNKYLPSHKELIEKIKTIHVKLSGGEEFLDNETIDKVNKISSETLPITLLKYQQIDINFRDTIKNIEGKNAHQLLEESLTNILFSMQEIEIYLEQLKVNDLSLVNRKNRIK